GARRKGFGHGRRAARDGGGCGTIAAAIGGAAGSLNGRARDGGCRKAGRAGGRIDSATRVVRRVCNRLAGDRVVRRLEALCAWFHTKAAFASAGFARGVGAGARRAEFAFAIGWKKGGVMSVVSRYLEPALVERLNTLQLS